MKDFLEALAGDVYKLISLAIAFVSGFAASIYHFFKFKQSIADNTEDINTMRKAIQTLESEHTETREAVIVLQTERKEQKKLDELRYEQISKQLDKIINALNK